MPDYVPSVTLAPPDDVTTDRAGWWWWVVALGWTVLVLGLCLANGSWVRAQMRWLLGLHKRLDLGGPAPTDTVLHFTAFLVMGVLYACSLGRGSWARMRLAATGACLLALTALGGALELAQGLSPGRVPDWKDFGANVAGVSLGLLVPLALGRLWSLRRGRSLLPAPWRE